MLQCLFNKISRRKEYGVENEERKKFERGAGETEVGHRLCHRWSNLLSFKEMKSTVSFSYNVHRAEDAYP